MNPNPNWHPVQPRDGEVVLLCGHHTKTYHWFRCEAGIEFQRPDGTRGRSHWIVSCQACYLRHGQDPGSMPIRTDGIWQGNAPIIKAREQN